MTSNLEYALSPTPKVSSEWVRKSELDRKNDIENVMGLGNAQCLKDFKVISCKEDGQVIVAIKAVMGPSERGTRLLDLEEILKREVDGGITVWAESLGDKNSLRNLRGIEVK